MFDRHGALNELQAATFRLREKSRLRMLLSRRGNIAVEIRDYRTWPEAIMPVASAHRTIGSDDLRLVHKTTDRQFYRDALAKAGTYEAVLIDGDGFVTEGCFSSIFVERGDKLVTPPLSRAILPGILRQNLIAMGEAEEGELRLCDLDGGFFIGNAARGMVAATLVAPKG
jgi:4-amino-4-deoxychorismate lyase/para-aminobenzoate synthetase/4-amino-4-deoxychorismate lyase